MTVVVDYSGGCADWHAHYMKSKCDHAIEMRTGCNKRFDYFCKVCARKWRMKTRRRYGSAIRHFRTPKFVTVTLTKRRSTYENLKRIWTMRKALFRKLRELGYRVDGWCGVVEFPNHIHMVVDCQYIPQWHLSKIWKTITGDSFIVDIRAVRNGCDGTDDLVRYITKYITKMSDWDGFNLDLIKGFHVIGSYGLVKESKAILTCPVCGSTFPWIKIREEEFFACGYDHLVPLDTG